jgi:hypothetical protein
MGTNAPFWLPRQHPSDCDHAAEYLALVLPARAAKALAKAFRRAGVEIHPAKNIVRAARITPLPKTNKKVKEDLAKIARGKKLSPILLVRGDAARDLPLIVGDGMHRLSAAWHHDESADVGCVLVDRPKT